LEQQIEAADVDMPAVFLTGATCLLPRLDKRRNTNDLTGFIHHRRTT
jgi:hypothetical protein